jgi:outer membrane protein TolC
MERMISKILLGATLVSLSFWAAGCNLGEPQLFDPRMMQQVERSHAGEGTPVILEPLPTTRVDPNGSVAAADGSPPGPVIAAPVTGRDLEGDPIVRMSLHEIIQRAVASNHDVKVAGYQPAIEGSRVVESEGNFDPIFFTNLQYQHKDELNGGNIYNTFNGTGLITSDVLESDTTQLQTGIQQNLDSGGQIQLQYETGTSWISPQQSLENPFYTSDITLQVTQPLLKNFGYDVNHARIVIDRLNQKVSLQEFRKAVEQNASDIEKAYWQLMQTERDIQIERDLVQQTLDEYNILFDRMQKGLDVSDLQVQQAASALESRRGQLVQFKAQARDLSDQIKGLMSDPDYPVSSATIILPADQPVEQAMQFDLEDQVHTAMGNRFELAEQQMKIDEATITESVAKNNLQPELDLTGSVGPQGAGANEPTALRTNAELDHIDGSIGFKLQVPLGNRAARGILERSINQRLQAIEQYQAYIESIAVDVNVGARAVTTTWERMNIARRARYDAQQALSRINDREKANQPLTPEFVQLKLQIQESLAQAWQDEAQALANYNIALAQLEKAKGTLLRYNNIVMQEDVTHFKEMGLLH